jgi:uncharacterized protein YaeQ
VLAFCLEYAEGIAFSNGLAEPDEPAVAVRELTGAIRVWIDVGAPDAARLHKAGKVASGERIHRAAELELYSVDHALLAELTRRLERRMVFSLSVTGGHLYVTIGDDVIEGTVDRHALEPAT